MFDSPDITDDKNISVSIDKVKYNIHPMHGDMLREWMEIRLATYYRQIIIFRNISAKVHSGSLSKNKEDRLNFDKELSEVAHEWITLSNYLTAISLGFSVDNPEESETEIVKSLSENEKTKIIMIQDKVNGLDMLSVLAEIDSKSTNKSIDSARAAQEEIDKEERLKNSIMAQVEKLHEDSFRREVKEKQEGILISRKLAKKLAKQLGPLVEANS